MEGHLYKYIVSISSTYNTYRAKGQIFVATSKSRNGTILKQKKEYQDCNKLPNEYWVHYLVFKLI